MACCLSIMSYLWCVAMMLHCIESHHLLGSSYIKRETLFCSEGGMINRGVSNDCVSRCKPLRTVVMHYSGH